MADLNKFERSRERITELLNYLLMNNEPKPNDSLAIDTLHQSLLVIDAKIQELQGNKLSGN